MTEITAPLPRGAAAARLLQLLALAIGSALLVVVGVSSFRHSTVVGTPSAGVQAHTAPRPHEPLDLTRLPRDAAAIAAAAHARAALDARIAVDAARGFDRWIFVSSPGGALATAARVARWRPLVVRAVRGTKIDPNLLEAMVFVESSGYRDALAGGSLASPAGLTQLTAAGARSLGLRSARRFVARAELRATAGYLVRARHALGTIDLAVASYHLGVATLKAMTGGRAVSYADLYFGSAPDRNAAVWDRLTSKGAVARDYYWKVLAAERVMRLYRSQPGALSYEAYLQARKNSAEEVMHPRSGTPRFHSPRELAAAWKRHVLRAIPRDAAVTHIRVSGFLGQLSSHFGRSRRLYAGLRPQALDVLLLIGKRTHDISHASRPLLLTSAVRDDSYQRLLTRVNVNAAHTYSMHTTGYAFDILRSYQNQRQAAAFKFVLDRLQALHAIAYIQESAAMHIAVASNVSLADLRRSG